MKIATNNDVEIMNDAFGMSFLFFFYYYYLLSPRFSPVRSPIESIWPTFSPNFFFLGLQFDGHQMEVSNSRSRNNSGWIKIEGISLLFLSEMLFTLDFIV